MKNKVLFVDDDETFLKIYLKVLGERFDVLTASSGEIALGVIEAEGPFCVVVSDMQMPGMDGVELLERLKSTAPDTVRIMLTGVSDQTVAANAVNQGEIFRFLAKPPEREMLIEAVEAGIRQHQLICAEQVLLERTLKGSVEALAHVLSLSDPQIFGRTERITELMKACACELDIDDHWELETSAMLSQIGCITLPHELIAKTISNRSLSQSEQAIYARFPAASAELISRIPRMESIANIIRHQLKRYDGGGLQSAELKGEQIPIGSRILKVLHDFVRLESNERTSVNTILQMAKSSSQYDPNVIAALTAIVKRENTGASAQVEVVDVSRLKVSMIIAQEIIHLKTGAVLVGNGQKVTDTLSKRLLNFAESKMIDVMIHVQRPPL